MVKLPTAAIGGNVISLNDNGEMVGIYNPTEQTSSAF